MTERSKKLQRQFAKILDADDVEDRLTSLAENLRQRDAQAFEQDIVLLNHFPEFFSSVDKSYTEYDQQTKLAYHNLERSSTELNSANGALETLNLSIAAMLDTLEQGIFTFGADGLCSQVFSKSCVRLIECAPAGKHITEVFNLPADLFESTQALMDIIFTHANSTAFIDDFLDLLPKNFKHTKGLSVSLSYRPIFDLSGKIQSILVVATDHTDEIAAITLSREREAAAMAVLRISGNRNIFTRFYLSASIYFSVAIDTLSDHVPLENVIRDIHTLKGNASIFYLHDLVEILHEIETALDGVTTIAETKALLKARLPQARKALIEVKKSAAKIFGDDFDRQGSMRTIPLDLLRSFAVELRNKGNNDALAERFVSLLMGEPIRRQLSAFDIGLQELADRYGRKISPCVFTGENFLILTETYDRLFGSFTHISRNIVAHAIDSPEAREKWNKPTDLVMTIDTQRFERSGKKWFRVTFTDDGQGINTVRLRKKLKATMNAAQVDGASETEILQYIFNDNLSTSDQVDELSGRGVGMSAIKAEVTSLGGNINVESELNRFTRIIVEVPMIWA